MAQVIVTLTTQNIIVSGLLSNAEQYNSEFYNKGQLVFPWKQLLNLISHDELPPLIHNTLIDISYII